MNLLFNTLKFNIVRYNIGGGQNPAIYYPKQAYYTVKVPDASSPSYAVPLTNSQMFYRVNNQ